LKNLSVILPNINLCMPNVLTSTSIASRLEDLF
jgi:hypothetical protein